jgi:hypothetical protein
VTSTIITTVTPKATVKVTSTVIALVKTTVESTLVVTDTILATLVDTVTVDNTISTTTTVTAIVTSLCSTVAQPSPFYLQAVGAGVTGQFMYIPDEAGAGAGSFTPDCEGATQFTLDGNGNLYIGPVQYQASTDLSAGPSQISFWFTNDEAGIIYLTCSVTACGTLPSTLTCTGYQGATTLQLCPPSLSLGTSLSSQCQAISLTVVPQCVFS